MIDFEELKNNVLVNVVPLLNRNTLPCGLVVLKYIIDLDENIDSNSMIGNKTTDEITNLKNIDIAYCITNLLYYTVAEIHNTEGVSTIRLITKEYVNKFQS